MSEHADIKPGHDSDLMGAAFGRATEKTFSDTLKRRGSIAYALASMALITACGAPVQAGSLDVEPMPDLPERPELQATATPSATATPLELERDAQRAFRRGPWEDGRRSNTIHDAGSGAGMPPRTATPTSTARPVEPTATPSATLEATVNKYSSLADFYEAKSPIWEEMGFPRDWRETQEVIPYELTMNGVELKGQAWRIGGLVVVSTEGYRQLQLIDDYTQSQGRVLYDGHPAGTVKIEGQIAIPNEAFINTMGDTGAYVHSHRIAASERKQLSENWSEDYLDAINTDTDGYNVQGNRVRGDLPITLVMASPEEAQQMGWTTRDNQPWMGYDINNGQLILGSAPAITEAGFTRPRGQYPQHGDAVTMAANPFFTPTFDAGLYSQGLVGRVEDGELVSSIRYGFTNQ